MNKTTETIPHGMGENLTGALAVPLLNISRRNAERRLLALMELGNPAFLTVQMDVCITQRHREAIAELASCALTQAKYQGIAFTNLARRTAVLAGADEDNTTSISDAFVSHYTTMTDPAEQWSVARDMLIAFSTAIRSTNLRSCSPAVRQCCEYIDEHFTAPLSLNDLGELCGLSAHYVSDLFRKEMGMGALQYIHQIKLQHAKYLLEHSELSIAEIATLLAYPSHSNFSQRFRKNYGITPHEYRNICSK